VKSSGLSKSEARIKGKEGCFATGKVYHIPVYQLASIDVSIDNIFKFHHENLQESEVPLLKKRVYYANN